jgi:hypothetical protein
VAEPGIGIRQRFHNFEVVEPRQFDMRRDGVSTKWINGSRVSVSKFPLPLRWEFDCKRLILRGDWAH